MQRQPSNMQEPATTELLVQQRGQTQLQHSVSYTKWARHRHGPKHEKACACQRIWQE